MRKIQRGSPLTPVRGTTPQLWLCRIGLHYWVRAHIGGYDICKRRGCHARRAVREPPPGKRRHQVR